MKKILSIAAMSIIALATLVSCNKATPQSVAGNYGYDSFEITYSPQSAEADVLVAALKATATHELNGSSFTLNADKTWKGNIGNQSTQGTYELSENGDITVKFGTIIEALGFDAFKGNISKGVMTFTVDPMTDADAKAQLEAVGIKVCKATITFKK